MTLMSDHKLPSVEMWSLASACPLSKEDPSTEDNKPETYRNEDRRVANGLRSDKTQFSTLPGLPKHIPGLELANAFSVIHFLLSLLKVGSIPVLCKAVGVRY
jgi:hypothetical protein